MLMSRAVAIQIVAGTTFSGGTLIGFHHGAPYGDLGSVSPDVAMGSFPGVPYMGGRIHGIYTLSGSLNISWMRTGASSNVNVAHLFTKVLIGGLNYTNTTAGISLYNDGTYSGGTWTFVGTAPTLTDGNTYTVQIS